MTIIDPNTAAVWSRSLAAGAVLQRLQARLQPRDVLDNPLVGGLLGTVLLCASRLPFSRGRKLALLAAAARRFENGRMLSLCRRLLAPWLKSQRAELWRRYRVGWGRYHEAFGNIARDRALTTSLLLKEPGAHGEKGVLYCSFEFNWMKLVANHDARRLFQEYFLVGASSWSPSDHCVLANLCGLSSDPVFVGISNVSDMAQYRLYAPDIQPVPIMACDWVDDRDFKPLPHRERGIDILMVAHFARWKRHWLLFEALSQLPPDLRVVLIGRNAPGRTERELREEAKAFGVRQELTILRNLEIEEVREYQCKARVSLALSKREGSCVSVTESLFADTPVLMMDDAHIGAREYINPATGRIAGRGNLARQLEEMIREPGAYRAREWARAHISARATSDKLNAILREHSYRAGLPWTRDLAPLCWRYVPRYLDEVDKARLRPGLEHLRAHHGIILEEFQSEREAAARKAS